MSPDTAPNCTYILHLQLYSLGMELSGWVSPIFMEGLRARPTVRVNTKKRKKPTSNAARTHSLLIKVLRG